MTVTLRNKKPMIVVPEAIRRRAGFRAGQQIEFEVSRQAIKIVPKKMGRGTYPIGTVMRIIKAAKEKPLTAEQAAALDAELAAYAAKQAKKLGIKERDIPRVIHESRSRRRAS